MEKTRTHYDVLGVSIDATFDEIRFAYRKLAKMHHPDSNVGIQQDDCTEKMATINNAYEILSDPDKRRKYDNFLSAQDSKAHSGGDYGRNGLIVCHNCNMKLSKEAKFCTNCGSKVKLIIEDIICSSCRKNKSSKDNFCPHCGYSSNNQVNIYDVFFSVFPNMKDIQEMKRLEFLESNFLAIAYSLAIGFPLAMFSAFLNFPESFYLFVVKVVSIFVYIRVAGHSIEGRIRNISLFEIKKIRSFTFKFIFFISVASIFSNIMYIISIFIFTLLGAFLCVYPPKK